MWSWGKTRDAAYAVALGVSLYLNMAQAARAEALAQKIAELQRSSIDFRNVEDPDKARAMLERLIRFRESLEAEPRSPHGRRRR